MWQRVLNHLFTMICFVVLHKLTSSVGQMSNVTSSVDQMSNVTSSADQMSNVTSSANQMSNLTPSVNQMSIVTSSDNQMSNVTPPVHQMSNVTPAVVQNSNFSEVNETCHQFLTQAVPRTNAVTRVSSAPEGFDLSQHDLSMTSHTSEAIDGESNADIGDTTSPPRGTPSNAGQDADKVLDPGDLNQVSASDYQDSLCPRRCRGDQVVSIFESADRCLSVQCFPCECRRPLCQFYGTCCPDLKPSERKVMEDSRTTDSWDTSPPTRFFTRTEDGRNVRSSEARILAHLSTALIMHRSTAPFKDRSTAPLIHRSTAPHMDRSTTPLIDRGNAPLIDWSTTSLIDRSTTQFIDWSIAPLIDRSTAPLIDRSTTPLTEWIKIPTSDRNVHSRGDPRDNLRVEVSTMSPVASTERPSVTHLTADGSKASRVYSPTLGCDDRFGMYIRSCPPAETANSTLSQLCEQVVPPKEQTLEMITRVVDKVTNVVYGNIYCAQCNHAVQFASMSVRVNAPRVSFFYQPLPANVTVECRHYMYVYTLTDPDELIRRALQGGTKCTLKEKFDDDVAITTCQAEQFSIDPLGTCNVTGLWSEYDEDVETSCHELLGNPYRVTSRESQSCRELVGDACRVTYSEQRAVYKNIFCAICNGVILHYSECSHPAAIPNNPGQGLSPPFTYLLNFGKIKSAGPVTIPFKPLYVFSNCSDSEWAAPDGGCLPLTCTPGKLLNNNNNNNTCTTVFSDIRGLAYTLSLFLTSDANATLDVRQIPRVELINYLVKDFMDLILKMLDALSVSFTLDLGVIETGMIQADDSSPPSYLFWVTSRLIANKTLSRDFFESSVLDLFVGDPIELRVNLKSGLQMEHGLTFRLKPSVRLQDSVGASLGFNLTSCRGARRCVTQSYNKGDFENQEIVKDAAGSFVPVSRTLVCSYVSFDDAFYSIKVNEEIPRNLSVTLDLNAAKLELTELSDLNRLSLDDDGGHHLRVCHQLLDEKLAALEDEHRRSGSLEGAGAAGAPLYAVTQVCVGVSMLCLCLSLLTYSVFPVLRTPAGLKNMTLSASILLSQASLQASLHASGQGVLCTFFGMSTHFLWLWMFVWTFICSGSMFRVFTAKTRSSGAGNATIHLVKLVTLSLVFPALVLAAVVTGSYFATSGAQIGYGAAQCYLDSILLIGITLAGPLVLITAGNTALFILTVRKIHKTRQLLRTDATGRDGKTNLYIYAKLSTMTGAFWALAIVAELLDADILRYIASVLNGLQGVFLFLSFVCNKRVLNLYLARLGLQANSSRSSETQVRTDRTLSQRRETKARVDMGPGLADLTSSSKVSK